MLKFYKNSHFNGFDESPLSDFTFVNPNVPVEDQVEALRQEGINITSDEFLYIAVPKFISPAPVVYDKNGENEADYIQTVLSLNTDFSKRKPLTDFFDNEDIENMRTSFQFMTIDEFYDFLNTIESKLKAEAIKSKNELISSMQKQPETIKDLKELKGYSKVSGHSVSMYDVFLESLDSESFLKISVMKISLLYEFNKINHKLAREKGLDYWDWEGFKYQTRYEAMAIKEWNKKEYSGEIDDLFTGSSVFSSMVSMFGNESDDFSEEDQTKANNLYERYSKLRRLSDTELELRRALAFDALIEQKAFDDAENICKIYEGLTTEMNNLLTTNETITDSVYEEIISDDTLEE